MNNPDTVVCGFDIIIFIIIIQIYPVNGTIICVVIEITLERYGSSLEDENRPNF